MRLWVTSEFPGLEVRAGRFAAPVPLHFHGSHEVALIEGGRGSLVRRGAPHALEPGALLLIAAGEPHAVEVPPGGEVTARVLHVPEALVDDVARGLPGRPRLPRFAALGGGQVADELRRLLETLSAPARPTAPREAFERAFAGLLDAHGRPAAAAGQVPALRGEVRRAREHLDAFLDARVSLEDLERLTGLSRFHLARAFSAQVGMPPHAYQAQVRVLFAKTLLRAGYELRDVAARCGFADQSHLSREFKRLVQVTPGRYARALRDPG